MMWKAFWRCISDNRIRSEKMIQRIYSKAMCLKEAEYPDLSRKVLKILDIMRSREEFYLEEAKGVLLALLAEISRENRGAQEENIEEKGRSVT